MCQWACWIPTARSIKVTTSGQFDSSTNQQGFDHPYLRFDNPARRAQPKTVHPLIICFAAIDWSIPSVIPVHPSSSGLQKPNMDDDGFTIVKSKGRTPRRRQSGRDKGKAVSRLAYDTRGQTSTFYGGSTSEDKLEKVLAILQTRRRQLLDDDQASGKGNTFLKRWKGRCDSESHDLA